MQGVVPIGMEFHYQLHQGHFVTDDPIQCTKERMIEFLEEHKIKT